MVGSWLEVGEMGEMGECDNDVASRRGDAGSVDTQAASSSSWIAGVEAERKGTSMLELVVWFLVVWAASAIFNSVSPLTENPMPDAPLIAVGELILKTPFIFPWWCVGIASERGGTPCGEEVECGCLELRVGIVDGPDVDRFLVRDFATLAREVPNDILPTGSGVSGITRSSSSTLSSDSSSTEKAEMKEALWGTAESDRWRGDEPGILLEAGSGDGDE
jgi:hypothetical protein